MFYWLFTEGRALVSPLLCPLSCLGLFVPIVTVVILGVGIQRRADGAPLSTTGWSSIAKVFAFIAPNIGVVAVYLSLFGSTAIQRATTQQKPLTGWLKMLVGGPVTINQARLLIMGFGIFIVLMFLNMVLWQGIRNGGWLREWIDHLRRPSHRRGEMGSAHLCTRRDYWRYRRYDPEGITFLGAYWGERNLRLDVGWGRFCLSSEDAARGVLTLGSPGSGKTQAVILPVIADRMMAGHSLIVADPQGELTSHVIRFARLTQHLVVVHDPTSSDGPRYNLAAGLTTIPAAAAIAKVLIPGVQGDNKFWTDAATDLLSACLIRFDNLGEIKAALDDPVTLSKKLAEPKDDATLAASAFIASVMSDGKVASNIIATLGTALTGWASTEVRKNTSVSDFDAELIISQKTVVVLTCPGEMREVYAPYLGATLRKLMRDLDRIGEQNKDPRRPGALPVPVGIILDEFPTLGRLDSLVADVNLVRKRRISILIGAQTKGQFHLIYGDEATKALLTGLATQIVYGACDHDTAEFYSKASGTATVDTDPDPRKASLRQRPLLTADEIVNPQHGNCTIFSRFVEANHALQVIMQAELTRLYEREDWKERLATSRHQEPMLLKRGICLSLPDRAESSIAPTLSPVPIAESSSGSSDTSILLPPASASQSNTKAPASLFYPGDTPSEYELNAIFGSSDEDRTMIEYLQKVRQRSEKQNEGNAFEEAGITTTSLSDFMQHLTREG